MSSILFVCTANICRSPMAEGVLRKMLAERGARGPFRIDSAGTHDYHVGKPPFPMAMEAAKARGYEIAGLKARQVRPDDFDRFDRILAMDRANLSYLQRIAPTRAKRHIELLLEYGDKYYRKNVPDPFGDEMAAFEKALDMIEDGCSGLVEVLLRPTLLAKN